jgi:hypothetical protein
MSIKKMALIAATVTMMNLPLLAKADNLITVNNTNEDSTVGVMWGGVEMCAAKLPPYYKFTPAHGTSETTPLQINVICKNSFPCVAKIYMNKDCTPGTAVADGTLTQVGPGKYSVTVSNQKAPYGGITASGSTVTLNYG